MRVLVLGHKGMLGRAVHKYFSSIPNFTVLTTDSRWGDPDYEKQIRSLHPDFIINAIGKIPQKQSGNAADYVSINVELPRFLDTLGIKTILPSTDCEFSGSIAPGESYSKSSVRDATDPYGQSKAIISTELESTGKNTKIIRTSIIGHEEKTSVALLDWFLSQTGSINGYTNHYWNGITTLEWAKQCSDLILNWDKYPTLIQLGTKKHYSKFEILTLAREVYKQPIEILPFTTKDTFNKTLKSDKKITDLPNQLKELKVFFSK